MIDNIIKRIHLVVITKTISKSWIDCLFINSFLNIHEMHKKHKQKDKMDKAGTNLYHFFSVINYVL